MNDIERNELLTKFKGNPKLMNQFYFFCETDANFNC
jgi:hypothetical protein